MLLKRIKKEKLGDFEKVLLLCEGKDRKVIYYVINLFLENRLIYSKTLVGEKYNLEKVIQIYKNKKL
jgi:hypothetical protein